MIDNYIGKDNLIGTVLPLEKIMRALNKRYLLDQTFKHSLDAIIFTDEKGYIIEANQAYSELTGYKNDEIIGKHTSEFAPMKEGTYECTTGELIQIDKKCIEQLRVKMRGYIETGKLQNAMGYQLRKDCKIVPVEDTMIFLVDNDGERIGGVAVIRDNTLRRKAEIEISKTKDYLENIIMTSLDGIIITDAKGSITGVNKAVEKIFDCSSDQLVGKHFNEMGFDRKSLRGEGLELMDKLLNKGAIYGVERVWTKASDNLVNIEMNIALLKDDKGSITGSIASIRDITDRKKAEEALKDSEEKYCNLIEHANDAIVSVNTKGMIIGFNKKAEEMFGYSSEDVLGKSSYALISHRNKDFYKDALVHFAQTGTSLVSGSNILEGRAVKKSGEEFNVEYSYYTINIKGEYISTAIIRDITKRKIAEQKLIEYQQKLKSLASQLTLTEEKERRRFAELLHNEIGQNLFAIQLQLQQLKHFLTSADNIKTINNILDNLKQTIHHSRSLTFELSSPILYELGLEKALEWLVDEMSQKYNIAVTFSDDKKKKPVDDDVKIFIYQAVRELLTNVVKHAQVEKASVSIRKNNSSMEICVEDNGHGFDPSCLETLDNMKDQFGLFHINERIKQLGGRIKIKSQPDGGTKITLTVPLKM